MGLSNQRHFGKSSEKASTIDGQISLFDYYSELFNEAEILKNDLVAAILTSKY
ncbi:MAG: hypothetical protein ACI4CW_02185 [Lachnospiraceae bacterium]